jgi:2,3-bisphosphoglycerate-dependent phosphoglycerate mutase
MHVDPAPGGQSGRAHSTKLSRGGAGHYCRAAMACLVLLRHGQSVWNLEKRFTGWTDVELTPAGEEEARSAGRMLAESAVPVDVVHTSLLVRAIQTTELALSALGRSWVPVRRHWRLNERHYGALQGLTHEEMAAEHGPDKVHAWRRSYSVRPPALATDDQRHPRFDRRYADLAPDVLPATECLADVVGRMLPYWYDAVVPDLRAGRAVLVSAHGNSLRALVKHLEGISDDAIPGLEIPTGAPRVCRLDKDMRLVEATYLS